MDEKDRDLKKEDKALRKEALELAIKGEGGLVVPSEGKSTLEVAYEYYRFLKGGCSEDGNTGEKKGEPLSPGIDGMSSSQTIRSYLESMESVDDNMPTIDMEGIPVKFENLPVSEYTNRDFVEVWIYLNPSCLHDFWSWGTRFDYHVGDKERSYDQSLVKYLSRNVSSALEFVVELRADEVDLVQIKIPLNKEEKKTYGLSTVSDLEAFCNELRKANLREDIERKTEFGPKKREYDIGYTGVIGDYKMSYRKINDIPIVFEPVVFEITRTPSERVEDKFNGNEMVKALICLKWTCYQPFNNPLPYQFHVGNERRWSAFQMVRKNFCSSADALEYVYKLRADEVASVTIKKA